MADAPKIGNFTRFFVPGLAIGLVIGGLCGAYFSSRLEASPLPPPRPMPSVRTAPPNEGPRPAASSGSTGSTAPTASTAPAGEPAASPAPK